MSYARVKALWPGDRQEDLKVLPNAHGGAYIIWEALAQKYLNGRRDPNAVYSESLPMLYKDSRLPMHQRAVLLMTLDNAYIDQCDYAQAAQDIRSFFRDFPNTHGGVNHWIGIADIFDSQPHCPAIAVISLSNYAFEGSWDEEKGEQNPFDWSTTWNVYAKLRESIAESDQRRQAFEAAVKAERDPANWPLLFKRDGAGEYLNDWTWAAWWGWQKATAQQTS